MRRRHFTKILATIGPASDSDAMLEQLFLAGADVFRLNFSHGAHEDHRIRYERIRALEARFARPIAILADLQGPKLRVGQIQGDVAELVVGTEFRLDLDPAPGDARRAPLLHPEIFAALEPDHVLLLDDGKLRLRVLECGPDFARTLVEVGGPLKPRKGVNLPGSMLPVSAMTEKDRRDLDFALSLGVDYVALSFVQRPEDVAEAKRLIAGRAAVMAKLEKPSAIARLNEIVELSDSIMVARGDLGVEMPPEDVPVLQRRIVSLCRALGKPVVVATQMLESMIERPAPTRAEASDVATAVYEGADAVMLSAETASGAFPLEAVSMMNRIIERVQQDTDYWAQLDRTRPEPEATSADAISASVRQTAHTLRAAAIATYTTSGSTTIRIARERPEAPILSITPREDIARRLTLVWGVHSVRAPDANSMEEMVATAGHQARIDGFAEDGDRLVITAGVPFGTPGATNLMRIARVGEGSDHLRRS